MSFPCQFFVTLGKKENLQVCLLPFAKLLEKRRGVGEEVPTSFFRDLHH